MTHRGSWTAKVGDPIYLIETTKTYEGHPAQVATKVFTSESGFKAGLRAVVDDNRHIYRGAPSTTYRTFICKSPQWEETHP